MSDKKKLIVSLPTGLVHLRGQFPLITALPEFEFNIFISTKLYKDSQSWDLWGLAESTVYDEVSQDFPELPSATACLLLCKTFYNRAINEYWLKAFDKRIPIVAIEEVNQVAMNGGRMFHYVIPADKFMAASDYEAEKMKSFGIPSSRIRSTGWCLNSALYPRNNTLSFEPTGSPVTRQYQILLTLSPLEKGGRNIGSGETELVRIGMLEGLQRACSKHKDLMVSVKPHPIDDEAEVEKFLAKYLPGARMVSPKVSISDALDETELVINRGNSQVIIEALSRKIPVVLYPLGITTIFDEMTPDAVANSNESLLRIIENFKRGNQDFQGVYGEFISLHCSISPQKSLSNFREEMLDTLDREVTSLSDEDLLIYHLVTSCYLKVDPIKLTEVKRLAGGLNDTHLSRSLCSLLKGNITVEDLQYLVDKFQFPNSIEIFAIIILELESRKYFPSGKILKLLTSLRPFESQLNQPKFSRHHQKYLLMCYSLFSREELVRVLNAIGGDRNDNVKSGLPLKSPESGRTVHIGNTIRFLAFQLARWWRLVNGLNKSTTSPRGEGVK